MCWQAGNADGEIDALEGLGRVARRHLPSAVALRFYEDAISRATTLDDHGRAARLHNSAGIVEWTRGQYKSALGHFTQALSLFETLGDHVAAGQMMNSIGVSLAPSAERPMRGNSCNRPSSITNESDSHCSKRTHWPDSATRSGPPENTARQPLVRAFAE